MRKFILFLLLLPLTVMSQQITIKGIVIDEETKQPLPTVSVLIKGTTTGTYTDFDGNYQLTANSGDVLVFSFLGMKNQERKVTSSTILNVALKIDATVLDEVTISAGFFDINKKDVSGAITQVKSETLEKQRTQSVEQLLQGQVAGVIVTENGEPGGGIAISIRGTNSFLGGTQPLYIVDGLPVDPVQDAQGILTQEHLKTR